MAHASSGLKGSKFRSGLRGGSQSLRLSEAVSFGQQGLVPSGLTVEALLFHLLLHGPVVDRAADPACGVWTGRYRARFISSTCSSERVQG